MKGYKLVNETDSTFHIQHDDGSSFVVAKHGLDDAHIRKIQSLAEPVKMAEGGLVPEEEASAPRSAWDKFTSIMQGGLLSDDPAAAQRRADLADVTANGFAGVPTPTPSPATPAQAPVAMPTSNPQPASVQADAPVPQTPAPTPQAVPFGPSAQPVAPQSDLFSKAGNAMKSAAYQEAKAIDDQGKATAAGFSQFQQQAAAAQQAHDKEIANANARGAQLRDDINNFKIDPDRLWANKGAGNKLAAAIGVFLGGSGGGPNQALGFIQNQIKEDIEAQVSQLGSKKTLLEANLKETGEIHQAYARTMDTMLTVAKTKAEQAAANAMGPVAKAKAMQLVAGVDQQIAQNRAQMALMAGQVATASGGVPMNAENPSLLLNKDYSERRVAVGNRVYSAATPDDAKDVKKFQSAYEPLKDSLNRLKAIGPSALVPGPQSEQASAIQANLIPKLNEIKGISRLSEVDVHLLQNTFSNPQKFRTWLAGKDVRTDELLKSLEEDADAKYKAAIPGYHGSVSSKGAVKPGFTK